MVLQFTGENTAAQSMMQEAIVGTWLNNSDHQFCVDWGSLRTDLGFQEESIIKTSVYSHMVYTWRYDHSQFPKARVCGHTYGIAIDVENGFKFSLDIPTQYPMDLNKLDDEV